MAEVEVGVRVGVASSSGVEVAAGVPGVSVGSGVWALAGFALTIVSANPTRASNIPGASAPRRDMPAMYSALSPCFK